MVASAGCLSTPGGSDGESGVRLARLSVKNEDDRDHIVHVIVKRGGDIAHWSSHGLAAPGSASGESSESVPCTWGGQDGRFEILARLDDAEEWRSTVVSDQEADCYQASVEVGEDGSLGVWYTTDCDIPATETCDVPTATPTDE